MGRVLRRFGLGLAATLAVLGCHRPDSVLLVEVAGDETLPVAQLSTVITIGATTKMFFVPPAPTTIQLPTSFSVELDPSLTGPVSIYIQALDSGSVSLASGQTVQEHINVGDDTIIPVTLAAPAPAPLAAAAGPVTP